MEVEDTHSLWRSHSLSGFCDQIKLCEFNLDFKIMEKFSKVYFRTFPPFTEFPAAPLASWSSQYSQIPEWDALVLEPSGAVFSVNTSREFF